MIRQNLAQFVSNFPIHNIIPLHRPISHLQKDCVYCKLEIDCAIGNLLDKNKVRRNSLAAHFIRRFYFFYIKRPNFLINYNDNLRR